MIMFPDVWQNRSCCSRSYSRHHFLFLLWERVVSNSTRIYPYAYMRDSCTNPFITTTGKQRKGGMLSHGTETNRNGGGGGRHVEDPLTGTPQSAVIMGSAARSHLKFFAFWWQRICLLMYQDPSFYCSFPQIETDSNCRVTKPFARRDM